MLPNQDYAPCMQGREDIRIIRHPRARRLRLRFDLSTGEAVLTLPPRASTAQARAFLETQQDWLRAQRLRMSAPVPFVPGLALTILGEPITLQHVPDQKGGAIWSGGMLAVGGRIEHFARRVQSAIRARALAHFSLLATDFSARLGLGPPRVVLRDTRSRWGSCTAQGHIQLSWRLAFAPFDVSRYVVAHEVAHRREMNHSPRFWAIVSELAGPHEAERRWLSEKGYTLLRLGVAELPQEGEFLASRNVFHTAAG